MLFSTAGRVASSEQVLLFGEGAAGDRLQSELRLRGVKTVGLIVSPSASATGLDERVQSEALSGCSVRYVLTTPPGGVDVTSVAQLAASIADEAVDAIVAVGGGTTIDTAKGLALALATGGEISDYFVRFEAPDVMTAPKLPQLTVDIVAVPTTLSGAEVTPSAGFRAQGEKRLVRGSAIAPRLVSSDPNVIAATPTRWLHSTAMCALAHCVEALYAPSANAYSAALAVEAAERIGYGLRGSSNANRAEDLAILGSGSVLAGLAMASVRSSLQHAIAHVLGAMHGIAHGDAHAVMLPHVMAFNLEATRTPQRRFISAFARGLGDNASATDPAGFVRRFRERLEAPDSLEGLGVRQSNLVAVAEATFAHPGAYANPRRIDAPDALLPLLEAAW